MDNIELNAQGTLPVTRAVSGAGLRVGHIDLDGLVIEVENTGSVDLGFAADSDPGSFEGCSDIMGPSEKRQTEKGECWVYAGIIAGQAKMNLVAIE